MIKFLAPLLMASLLAATSCAAPLPAPAPPPESPTTSADLSGIKTYLLDQASALKGSTSSLKAETDRYYGLAEAAGFDYEQLWRDHPADVIAVVEGARNAWIQASPQYEKMEGIVAGTPTLAGYDVILDAGASGAEDPENAAPIDLTLADGRVLARPGNLFGVTESTLWGTYPAYTAGVDADLDQDGLLEFGEMLPDAAVLQAGANALNDYAGKLLAAAETWTPNTSDAFTALVVMVPTMSEYFESWRNSRFVSGESSTQRDFVAISRLADMQDILGGLQVVYRQVRPLTESVDPAQAEQIETQLNDLRTFVGGVYQKEQAGQRFTAEQADLLGSEAQQRATAITGQISQIAAQLGVEIQG